MMASQTIKEKFVELKNSKQTPRNARSKIQRVADHLKNRKDFEEHYTPKLVSFGPIHHDNTNNTNLKLGEKYKLMWASKYIENTRLIAEELHKKIVDNINELKSHFSDDVLTLTGKSLESFGSLEEKLSWILFVDGCSFLHILEKAMLREPDDMNIKFDQLVLVMMDVVLLENQLPYAVLKLLWKDNNDAELIKSMTNFLIRSNLALWSEKENDVVPNKKGEGEHSVSMTNESQSETPTHLLDLMHKLLIITTSKSKTRSNEINEAAMVEVPLSQEIKIWSQLTKIYQWLLKKIKICSQNNSVEDEITYTGIEDLRAVGIRLESSFRDRLEIDYSKGWFTAKLTIPTISVNNFTATIFLNLVSYEMCPDFENDYGFCSFVAFMDSLIDHPEDVKALRSNGILYTFWSNEDVAKLFNTMGTDLVHNNIEYYKVNFQLEEHYRKKYKTWIALGFRTYFNNPWAVIAFLPAFIALALTFIQTWFAIHPANNKGG